jgi:hypothetical protein
MSGNPNYLCMDKSKGKVMFEVFFGVQCLVHCEFIPEGHKQRNVCQNPQLP